MAQLSKIFIEYIRTYWINGCYPPQVWNCWSRSEDLTNNNQEGYNAKTNRCLRQIHPSPGILLCHVRSEIKLAEQTAAQARNGIEKPRGQTKYRTKAETRLAMKKEYLKEKQNGTADIGEFLSNMGHNIMASMLCGKTNELKKTANPRESLIFENDGRNHDVSTWVPDLQHDLSTLDPGENPYLNRRIGKSKKRQEEEEIISRIPWLGKKCPACGKGFNRTSKTVQCHSCDSFTHQKSGCLSASSDKSTFHCKKCKNIDVPNPRKKPASGILQCNFCDYKTEAKFNLERHISRKHPDGEKSVPASSDEKQNETEQIKKKPLSMQIILGEIGLPDLNRKFESEGISLKLLLELSKEDLRRMLSDLEIRWGDRYKIEKQVEKIKNENETFEDSPEHTVIDSADDIAETVQQSAPETVIEDSLNSDDSECSLCAEASKQKKPQHKCRKCGKVVCNLFCSISDPNSDNEMHRVHKPGDVRCIPVSFSQGINFTCPNCDEKFTSNTRLDDHVKEYHEPFESTFPTMSLASDGSLSDIEEKCKECGKLFENELDLANHIERVHEYGETFALYPCEECGFRGADLLEIKSHIDDEHGANKTNSSTNKESGSLEDIGIFRLPEITERRKQNFDGLNIDANGEIEVEDDDDIDFDSKQEDELLLMEEDDWIPPTITTRSRRLPKPTVSLAEAVAPNKKRKADDIGHITQKKQKKKADNLLECMECKITFSRKFNLARHIRNKH